jgi:hypothetical protein
MNTTFRCNGVGQPNTRNTVNNFTPFKLNLFFSRISIGESAGTTSITLLCISTLKDYETNGLAATGLADGLTERL